MFQHQEWDLVLANLLTQARWFSYVAFNGNQVGSCFLMLLFYPVWELPIHSNVICFTSHRLTNTTIRGNGHGKAKVIGRIDTLHNLRLQYDRHKGVKGIPKRSYYLHAPKYAGGLDTRGRTPTHINSLVDMLREEASPAKVLELNIVAKVADLDTLSKSGASS